MNKSILCIFSILLLWNGLFGQHTSEKEKITEFIRLLNNRELGNQKEFREYKNLIENLPIYSKAVGKLSIDTLFRKESLEYICQLSSQEANHSRIFLKFIFTKAGRLKRVEVSNPTLLYPKTKPRSVSEDMISEVESLKERNYLKDSSNRFNGCLMILDKNKKVFSECYGYANFEDQTVLNDSTLFDIGSCAKQFTAYSILLLSQENQLKLTDLVTKYIPDFPYPGITIEHLLGHTSGLVDYVGLFYKKWDKSKYATNADIVSLLKKYQPKLLFEPGEQFKYTNTGYALLSIIIERVSGLHYSEIMKKNIFTPLGMKRTRVYNTRRSKNEKIENYAYGYLTRSNLQDYDFKETQMGVLPDSVNTYQFVKYLDAITGDGNISSNLKDLAIWNNELREGVLLEGNVFDEDAPKRQFNNGQEVDYRFGFFTIDEEGFEQIVYHTGAWPGYYSIILRLVDQDKTVVVLSNNSYEDFLRLTDEIAVVMLRTNNIYKR